ncbi:acyl-CoA:lysophosphatidylglycerol acyltransferase 1 [Diachasma alloeum]|uniref:acyl-CoA:lysophosphatidylglycerol acyltransferase 1 n=1 Tax=Diachasma alloeum TaxID=454923 RepID=UPI00073819D2|nr:acyl-CoA:lysophosphatidylglycerol acyltransferase 1 [Diachasma alloeum]
MVDRGRNAMVDNHCPREGYSIFYSGWHLPKMTDSSPSSSAFINLANNIVTLVKCILRTGFVLINNVYCIPTYVVWMMLLLPVKVYHPQMYWRIEGLFFHWLLAMVSMWTWSAGYDIIEQGDDIHRIVSDRTLVIANHQSTGDVPILMTTFNAKPNVLPNLMWIMDSIFKFTNFGVVSMLHQDFFISSGRKRREESLRQLERHLEEAYVPRERKWMVLFPEGGFLCKRRETSQKYAKKNNLPILENVTLPRVGAMRMVFEKLGPAQNNNSSDLQLTTRSSSTIARPEISWVLDITIAYPQGKPIDLPTIVTGSRSPCETVLFYRLYPSSVVPRDPELLSKWLYDRWVEKETLLDNFYKYGSFLGPSKSTNEGTKIQQDPLRYLVLHLFFITSSYIHYNIFSYVLSCIW